MTPGIQPIKVSIILTTRVVPTPCFKKTAKGGKKIFNRIVTNDIDFIFKELVMKFAR